MSPDTDHDIQRLLAELSTPAHGAGFWDGLRAELERGVDPGDGPVRLDEMRITRAGGSRRLLAVAAAVLLVVAGAGVLVTTRDDGPVDVISEPTVVTPPATVEPADEGALRPDGEPTRGSGQVVAVSPDGEWLYVADADPAGGMGCEGTPRQTLFVQPTDGPADGERRLASDTPIDATGGTDLAFGPDGSVAVHSFCESFLTELGTGVVTDDGTITGYEPIDLADDVASVVDLAWSAPGVLRVSTYGLGSTAPEGRGLFEIDIGTGRRTSLPAEGIVYLDATAAGEFASRDNVGTVRFEGEVLETESHVSDLVVSDDGRYVVTTGNKGVMVHDRETGAEERIFDEPAFSPTYLESGDVIFSTRDDRSVGRVLSVQLGDVGSGDHAFSTLFSDAGVGDLTQMEVTPDGSHLFASYVPPADAGEPVQPVLLSQPLAR